MLIDSHAHLTDDNIVDKIDDTISKLASCNVEVVIEVGYSVAQSVIAANVADKYHCVFAAVGVHPSENMPITDGEIATLESLLRREKVVAIGEVGLDYHYDNNRDIQRENFMKMIDLAERVNMPLILHIRDAYGDMESQFYDILKEKIHANILFHCFSGSVETVKTIIKKLPNSYFAFGGAVTFKNFRKGDVLACIPQDRLLLETDCPYMSPEPHRGKPNSSLYLQHIAAKVAEIRGWSLVEVEKITTDNARKFFGI